MSRLRKSSLLGKLLFLVGLLLLWSLVKGFFDLKQAYRRIDEAKEVLELEETKHKDLLEKLGEVQQEDYIEKVIRNELNMQKDGEMVVVLQDDGAQIGGVQEPEIDKKEGMWKKWFDLWR